MSESNQCINISYQQTYKISLIFVDITGLHVSLKI